MTSFHWHAFARNNTAVIDLNAVLLCGGHSEIPQRNGPLAGGVENFPVETIVFATKRSLVDSRTFWVSVERRMPWIEGVQTGFVPGR